MTGRKRSFVYNSAFTAGVLGCFMVAMMLAGCGPKPEPVLPVPSSTEYNTPSTDDGCLDPAVTFDYWDQNCAAIYPNDQSPAGYPGYYGSGTYLDGTPVSQ